MNLNYTTKRDVNGNSKAQFFVESLGHLYTAYCAGAQVGDKGQLNFSAVVDRLKKRFGYRSSKKQGVDMLNCFFEGEKEMKAEIHDAFVFAASLGRLQYSRDRYMNALRRCTHQEYYVQFGDAVGLSCSNDSELLSSVKAHLNDHHYTKMHASFLPSNVRYYIRLAESTAFVNYRGGVSDSCATSTMKAQANKRLQLLLDGSNTDIKKRTEIRNGYFVTEYTTGFVFDYEGETVTPQELFACLLNAVPLSYNTLFEMLCASMYGNNNKDMLRSMMVANKHKYDTHRFI